MRKYWVHLVRRAPHIPKALPGHALWDPYGPNPWPGVVHRDPLHIQYLQPRDSKESRFATFDFYAITRELFIFIFGDSFIHKQSGKGFT